MNARLCYLAGLGLPEESGLLACTVLERRVPLGVRKLAKVQVGQDVYYIPEGELKDIGDVDVIYYIVPSRRRSDSGGQCASCQLL